MSNGVSIISNQIPDFQYSISVVPDNIPDKQYGVSGLNQNNLFIEICDTSNNPIQADIIISGGSGVDGNYSGFSEYPLTTITTTNIDVTASASGFISKTENIDEINSFGYKVIKIILEPSTVDFLCTTLFKNEFGATVTKPLRNGYVEVTFSGSTDFNYQDYSTLFEAIPVGSSKYNSVVLNSEVINSGTDFVTYRVDVVQENGDYCYLSNITRDEC